MSIKNVEGKKKKKRIENDRDHAMFEARVVLIPGHDISTEVHQHPEVDIELEVDLLLDQSIELKADQAPSPEFVTGVGRALRQNLPTEAGLGQVQDIV